MKKKKRFKKFRKFLEINFLILLISWGVIMLIDYYRYQNNKKPLIIINAKINDYKEGSTTTYTSLGYVYRVYEWGSVRKTELVPMWVKEQTPPTSSRYPSISTDTPPNNPDRLPKVEDTLFFYDDRWEVSLAYKCLNNKECHIAKSKNEPANMAYASEELAIYNNYVFIDDSKENEKNIYIVDLNKKEIVYEVEEVIATTLDKNGKAATKDGKYVVVNKEGKYGQISLEDNIIESVAFNYDYVKYNPQSNTYTTKTKYWIVTDFKENIFVSNSPIDDAYLIDKKYIIKTSTEQTINERNIKTYKLINTEHLPILNGEYYSINILSNNFIVLDNYLELQIKDLNNKNLLSEKIKVHINPLSSDETPFLYQEDGNNLIITIYYPGSKAIDKYQIDKSTYKIIKKDLNIAL